MLAVRNKTSREAWNEVKRSFQLSILEFLAVSLMFMCLTIQELNKMRELEVCSVGS